MRLDAHQHFWNYNSVHHSWITDHMSVLKRDFLPSDLQPLLHSIHFDGCVAVQAQQNLQETAWLLELAEHHPWIQAVVGWVDLCSETLPQQLETFGRHPKFAGVRHVLQDEPDDHFMLRPAFRQGIRRLRDFGLTYDLLLYTKHLPMAAQLVEEFPQQPFVLDHLAKPKIAAGELSPWKEDLHKLAKLPNVSCKLSGMVTEGNWKQWSPGNFHPYLDVAFGVFGWGRLMIGSDWPVCTLAGDYEPIMNIVIDYVRQLPQEAQAAVLGDNCARFYGIRT